MRVIDDRGRLFGIINLLDLLVLSLVIVLIASASLNLMKNSKGTTKDSAELYVKVLARVPSEVAHNPKVFKSGDKVLAGNAVVEKILEIKPVAGDTGYSDIIIHLRANCVILNNEYYCANASIKVNSPIIISNPAYIFNNAIIIDVEKV